MTFAERFNGTGPWERTSGAYDPAWKLQTLVVDQWLECVPKAPSKLEILVALRELNRSENNLDGTEDPSNPETLIYWLYVMLHQADAESYPADYGPTAEDGEASGIVREALDWVAHNPSPAHKHTDTRGESRSAGPQLAPNRTQMNLRIFHCTDTGNAERLVNRHGADIRYCHPQKDWYYWDSARWIRDQRGHMMGLIKDVVRGLYEEASQLVDDGKRKKFAEFAQKSESTDRKKAALVSAQSEPGIPILPCDFDTDPDLLNCLNGTIDLRTGERRPHRREDLITKMAPVNYDPDARSPLWERFLDDITEGNREYRGFLQRIVGYSLTGDVSEEKLFFVHGPGASGKSTFLEAVKAALGEYAKTADFETFVQRTSGAVRDDIAELAGRRFVVSIEVDEGKKLAEGLTKSLTGGDTVRARFLYQGGFEFRPCFKLWLAANHAPKIKHDDSAMWRRILRIPFEHVVPKEKRDPSLKARLKNIGESGPAILAWAVKGCLQWRENGLGVPPVVEDATEQYRFDMDPIKDFLGDCCVLTPDTWGTAKALRHAYEEYCRDHGDKNPLAPREFAACLRSRGCESDHRRTGNVWVGIGLRADDSTGGVM